MSTGPTDQPPTGGQPMYGSQQPVAPLPQYGQQQYGQQQYGQSEYLGAPGTDVVGDEPRGGGRPKFLIPLLIGLAVVLVIGGGAFAVRAALGGNGDQPAAAIPGDALLYGRVDLDPSGSQKIAALQLASKFPDFADATGIEDTGVDLREKLWDAIAADSPDASSLDYATDIEPWLGDRAAIAYVRPASEDQPETGVIFTLQVTDQDAAEEGLGKLMANGGDEGGVAFSGDYAVIAVTQELADQYVAEAAEGSLADAEEFSTDMAALGDPGVASFWMSADASSYLEELAATEMPLDMGGSTALGDAALVEQGSVAAALRFDADYVEIAFAGQQPDIAAAGAGQGPNPAASLPDTTLAAIGATYEEGYVEQMWSQILDQASATGIDIQRDLRQFEKQTGIALPDDLSTLLGSGFAFAVDGQGLDEIAGMEDLTQLRIGAVFKADPTAAGAVLDKITALAGPQIELAQVADDGLVGVSLNEAYAGELTSGTLGQTDAFAKAVAGGADAQFVAFFSMDALEASDIWSEIDPEVARNLELISAIGMSASNDGDIARGSLRVVIE